MADCIKENVLGLTSWGDKRDVRRKLVRFDLNQPVTLTTLGAEKVQLEGTMTNVSEEGYKLLLPQALRCGTAVEIDMPDAMLLGEVRYCRPEGDGTFGIGLENIQILSNIGALSRLVNGILGSSSGRDRSPAESSVSKRR